VSSTRDRTATPMLSVYSGRDCIGFVLVRGRSGYEALDASQASLGTFPTQEAAIHRISGDQKESPAGGAREGTDEEDNNQSRYRAQ
jgi:hypothetical protein